MMEVGWEELVGAIRVRGPIYICNAERMTRSDEADTRKNGQLSEPGIEMLPRGLRY